MKVLTIIFWIIAALMALSIVPYWISLKRPENKYWEYEGRRFCIDIWGMSAAIIVLSSMMYFD